MKDSTFLSGSEIIDKAIKLGYADGAVIDLNDSNIFARFAIKLQNRCKKIPESYSFYKNLFDTVNPAEHFNWAESLLVCIWRYGQYKIPDSLRGLIGKFYLFDGRLKFSDNYQARKKLENYLTAHNLTYSRTQTPARWAVVEGGLGNFARNNFVFTEYGSWVYIETWLLDKQLESVNKSKDLKCPKECRRCVEACPTGALSAPFELNPRACIAYLTYYKTGVTPLQYREKMGKWLYGCDICQDVCPLNDEKWEAKKKYPGINKLSEELSLARIYNMNNDYFQENIHPRFFYNSDLGRWKMNALRAMGNSSKKEYIHLLKNAKKLGKDVRISEMADWSLKKLNREGYYD